MACHEGVGCDSLATSLEFREDIEGSLGYGAFAMEILVKSFPSAGDESSGNLSYPRIDFSDHLEIFGFGGALHRHNRKAVADLAEKNPLALADLLAAEITTLYSAGVLRNDIVKLALRCCRDILQDHGFRYIESEHIKDYIEGTDSIIVLIVGCQSRDLLERRVKAAVRICDPLAELKRDIRVCFSGSHPSSKAVRIPNEAMEMKVIFEAEIARRRFKRISNLYHDLITESRSTTTAGNIRNVADRLRDEMSKPCSVFLVTSSFHVHRLYAEFERQILSAQGYLVRNVMLVGAEGFGNETAPYKVSHVKQLIFEVYRHLLTIEQFQSRLGARSRQEG